MKVVMLSAYTQAAFTPQLMFVVLISVRGWVDNRAIVRQEWIGNRTRDLPACTAVPKPSAPRVRVERNLLVRYPRHVIRGDADKSLARPGRKQATATNSGFIQHTPHEAQYTFASHSKKIQKFVRPTRSPRPQWPPRRTKSGDLSIVFFIPRNIW